MAKRLKTAETSAAGEQRAAVSDAFRARVRAEGVRLYRDLPWRNTRDPYEIWLSEVMLQQTQVARVAQRWGAWLERFPGVADLAAAPVGGVLAAWQGMGYDRRALAVKSAAEQVVERYDGAFPRETEALVALPGIGPATAQGIRAFAFDLPGVYLETNVRSVFLHELFPDAVGVPDRELKPLVEAACPGEGAPYAVPQDADDSPRSWYYALLDYGAYLKQTLPNPSRRSAGHVRQSAFTGSRRQKRAELVRLLLADREDGAPGATAEGLTARLSAVEQQAGRSAVDQALVEDLLAKLAGEGFCNECDGLWRIA